MTSLEDQAKDAIPSEFRMISGCEDKQTSADVSNVASFRLPDPAGRAGGACTSALLSVLYADHQKPEEDLSFREVLLKARETLDSKGYEQIPQLSSSRPFSVETTFDLVPDNFEGEKRAVLVGINYVGQEGELSGCHNDVLNIKEYIMDAHGFPEENIKILMDDGVHIEPTKENICNAYSELVASSKAGDAVFCHYSGHGGKLRDRDGDEADGYDETLIPVDYARAGQIRDDDLLRNLVIPMAKGVFATCIMDCCHSGTVLDLPFNYKADGEQTEMVGSEGYDFAPLLGILTAAAGGTAVDDAVQSAMNCCNTL